MALIAENAAQPAIVVWLFMTWTHTILWCSG